MSYLSLVLAAIIGAVAGSTATALSDRWVSLIPLFGKEGRGEILKLFQSKKIPSPSLGSRRAGGLNPPFKKGEESNDSSFFTARSQCRTCKKTLTWSELIPIVSWLIQKGRCRKCNTPIGWPVLIVELFSAIIAALSVTIFGLQLWLIWLWILLVIFSALAITDIESQELPDALVLALIPFIIIISVVSPTLVLKLKDIIFGAIIIGGIIGLIYALSKGKGMGFGDVKLAAVLGLGLGWQVGLVALFFAFTLGGIVAGYLLITKRAHFGARVAFGPFLIIGYFLALLYGQRLISWYYW